MEDQYIFQKVKKQSPMNLVIIQNNFYNDNQPVDIITDQVANYKPLFMPFATSFDDR